MRRRYKIPRRFLRRVSSLQNAETGDSSIVMYIRRFDAIRRAVDDLHLTRSWRLESVV